MGEHKEKVIFFFPLLPCSFQASQKRPFQSHETKLLRLHQGKRELGWRKRDKGGRGDGKVKGKVVWLDVCGALEWCLSRGAV